MYVEKLHVVTRNYFPRVGVFSPISSVPFLSFLFSFLPSLSLLFFPASKCPMKSSCWICGSAVSCAKRGRPTFAATIDTFSGPQPQPQTHFSVFIGNMSDVSAAYVVLIRVKRHLPLPSARQHPSYGDCLEVKREYYQNCSMLSCMTQCSQSAAHSYEQFLQVQQIGFVTL